MKEELSTPADIATGIQDVGATEAATGPDTEAEVREELSSSGNIPPSAQQGESTEAAAKPPAPLSDERIPDSDHPEKNEEAINVSL